MDVNYYKKYEPIDGKWYIGKELGRGAFGIVFEIERRDFSEAKSALKVITVPSTPGEVEAFRRENYRMDEDSTKSYFYGFVEEFTKEIKMMYRLRGYPNIVNYEDHDVIPHEGKIGWDILLRMELLTPMSEYFANNVPVGNVVAKLGADICRALSTCKKFNVIHRDIKPANIFVSNTGDFKLGDFGVARTLEKTSGGLSKKGTYTYMAPEVYKGEEYNSTVDIYSLGIVMYKLLNDAMDPFRSEMTFTAGEEALARRMRGETLPAPKNAEGKLAEIILKACAYNPSDRYATAEEMLADLESLGIFGGVVTPAPVAVDEDKTVGIFDAVTETTVDDDKTAGLFDTVEEKEPEVEDDDKTVGIFDSVEVQEVAVEPEDVAVEPEDVAVEPENVAVESNVAQIPPQKKEIKAKNEPEKPKSKKTGLIIAIIASAVVLVALLCVGGYFLLGGNGDAPEAEIADTYSDDELTLFEENGKVGYKNALGEVVIELKFDNAASSFSEGLAWVRVNGKEGFIDKTGNIVIEPQFDYVGNFSEGLAWVELNDKRGFIDKNGKIVIQPQFDWASGFSEGLAAVELNGESYYIDKNGNRVDEEPEEAKEPEEKVEEVAKPAEKTAQQATQPAAKPTVEDRTNMTLIASSDASGEYGFMNTAGNWIIQPKYGYAGSFSEGLALVELNDKYGFIDKNGNFAIQLQFDLAGNFSEGLAGVKLNGKWGYIDKTGRMVIEPQFDSAWEFSEGLAAVKLNGKYGFIDNTCNIVIQPQFDFAHGFSGGKARVNIYGETYFYIDKNGNRVD